MDSSSRRFRFGLYEFDTETLDLRREGQPVRIQPQPARLLAALVRRAGTLVPREELIRSVWSEETYVDFDEGLSYCVKQVRRSLRDDAENPLFVQNVPRRGYRFIAPVEVVAPAPEGEPHAPAAPAASPWDRPWVRNAVWFLLILMAIGLLYFIYEDFPRS